VRCDQDRLPLHLKGHWSCTRDRDHVGPCADVALYSLSYAATGRHAIRVGPPLRLKRVGRYLEVPEYGWVSDQFWPFMYDFVSPLPSPPPGLPPINDNTPQWDASPYAQDLDRRLRLNPKHAVCWGFEVATDRGYITMWATLGQSDVVRWSWFGANVRLRFLKVFATIANFFIVAPK
jgi:hypothetical protein